MSKFRLYEEDELLPLSGIQHFAYCERQWGLIHIEQQWIENISTVEGKILHQRVDDPYFIESRGDVKTVRSVPLFSKTLGLYGVADMIELHKDRDSDNEQYSIVEYKRGKPKPDDRDEVQLCAQAICLEEMLKINLNHGYMFYDKTKHRYKVLLSQTLRARVRLLSQQMHDLYAKGETPFAEKGKRCNNCSMKDICIPKLNKKGKKVSLYLDKLYKDVEQENNDRESLL